MKTLCQKLAFSLITLLCLVFTVENAFAQRPHGTSDWSNRPQENELIQKMIDELGLTEAQIQQIKENKKKEKEQGRILKEKMKQTKDAIRTELLKDETNEKTLKRLVNELKAVQGEIVDQHIKSILTLKTILTPEQFRQFNEKMEQRGGRFSQFREKISKHWNRNRRSKPCSEQN